MSRLYALLFIISFIGFSSTGRAQWQWAAGSNHGAEGTDIATDRFGNVFAIGYNDGGFTLFGKDTINPHPGVPATSQPMIIKYDAAGNMKWVHGVVGGTAVPFGVTTDPNGNSYLFGTYLTKVWINTDSLLAPSGINQPYFIVKYDPAGNVKWIRTGGDFMFIPNVSLRYGGIAADSFGNIYITQAYKGKLTVGTSTITSTPGKRYDFFIARYDTSGNGLWVQQAGGSDDDYGNSIATSPSGNVYVAGISYSPTLTFGSTTLTNSGAPLDNSIFIAKYDPAGNVLWAKGMGGMSEDVMGITSDAKKNVYITGRFPQSYMAFGSITLTNPTPYPEIYTAKFDSSGSAVWAQGITTPVHQLNDITGYSVTADPCGNVWICGRMDSVIMLGTQTLTRTPSASKNRDDFFIAGYDASGNVIDYSTLIFGGDDMSGIAVDPSGNIFVCSDYNYGPFPLTPTITLTDPVPGSMEDFFVAKYAPSFAIAKDTIHLPTFDTTICARHSFTFDVPPGHAAYIWQDGSTATSFTTDAPGSYWVYASDPCSDTVTVDSFIIRQDKLDLTFSLGRDTVSCIPVTLTIPIKGVDYKWQDGSVADNFTATTSGTYYASVTTKGCTYADTITISVPHVSVHLRDTIVCREDPVQVSLEVVASPGAQIQWSNGRNTASVIAGDTGAYTVTVHDHGCNDSGSCHIYSDFCDCNVVIPNAFTPNDDGLNDYYHPLIQYDCPLKQYHFWIFNRWGEVVFYSTRPEDRWDGKLHGVIAEMGVYVYYLVYSAGMHNVSHSMKGDITLIR